jgi:hypothetical protein
VNECRCQRANDCGKGVESTAIGGESTVSKRVLVSCSVAKPGPLVNSRTIRRAVASAPNQSETGEKVNFGKRDGHFSLSGPGLAGSDVTARSGPGPR